MHCEINYQYAEDLLEEIADLKDSNLRLFKALLEAREEIRLLGEENQKLREGYTGP